MTRFRTTSTPPSSLQTGDLFIHYPDLFRLDSVIPFVHAVSPVLVTATHVVLAQRMGADGVWQPERWAFLVNGDGLNLVTGIDRDAPAVESPTATLPIVQPTRQDKPTAAPAELEQHVKRWADWLDEEATHLNDHCLPVVAEMRAWLAAAVQPTRQGPDCGARPECATECTSLTQSGRACVMTPPAPWTGTDKRPCACGHEARDHMGSGAAVPRPLGACLSGGCKCDQFTSPGMLAAVPEGD